MEILRIEDLRFKYPLSEAYALCGVSLSVRQGEFVVICGESGCGKTTLLRLIKKELSPVGELSGEVYYHGVQNAADIGFVMQDPDEQIVTDKVWHELAFGLENLGADSETIRRRVAETASYFGISEWFDKRTDELSGGQKQILNLASVTVMRPKILILDEPTAQLDPIAASSFISTLQKLNSETGITVIIVEHRLEEVFPIADKAVIMENGRIAVCAPPRDAAKMLREADPTHRMLLGMPSAVRIYDGINASGVCPLTVREGKEMLETIYRGGDDKPIHTTDVKGDAAIELRGVWFRYERDLPDVLKDVSLTVHEGELFFLLGGNGGGKSTLLNVISAIRKPYRGKVFINGKPAKDYGGALYRECLAAVPQDARDAFVKSTVREDLMYMLYSSGKRNDEKEALINSVAEMTHTFHLLCKNPLDLSGGEVQKCALAKALMSKPKILLLDEPTKGLDAFSKAELKALLFNLKQNGVTVLTVTHDTEFAAEVADRCALLFNGEVVSTDIPPVFFGENSFYTTAASRMSRALWKHAVTCDAVIKACKSSDKYK